MDKIWDRNPLKLEVIGHCGGDEKTEWPCRTDKVKPCQKQHWNTLLLESVSTYNQIIQL